MKVTVRYFARYRSLVGLSEEELDVPEGITVRELIEILKERHPEIRRSTVSILMNRLCERGLLKRSVETGRGGMRYVYSITTTREEFEEKVVKSILDALMSNFREATYAYLSKMKK